MLQLRRAEAKEALLESQLKTKEVELQLEQAKLAEAMNIAAAEQARVLLLV